MKNEGQIQREKNLPKKFLWPVHHDKIDSAQSMLNFFM